jgi:TPR repeat protein
MAIDKDNSYAMNNLGYYYHFIEKNYDLAKKYYMMAIDKGYSLAMNNLGYYYHFIEKNYDLAKKYYMIAIDKGQSNAMHNLAYYYENIEKNYDLAKKYYLMAINKGHLNAMNNIKQITTILERYVLFKKNNIKFDEEINKDIHIFNNKIKNHSIKDECKLFNNYLIII